MRLQLRASIISIFVGSAVAFGGCGQSGTAASPASSAPPASKASSQSVASSASASASGSGSAPASAAAKSGSQPAGATYTFGVMVPLTGPAATIGAQNLKGVDLAVEQINAAGGVNGLKLEPNVQDHRGVAQGGVEAMNQLANIAKVPYVITGFSSVTLAAQPIAAQSKILLINIGGTDVTLLNKPWLYNDMVMAPGLIPPLADYIWGMGIRNVAMLTSNDGYGDGNRKEFRASWEKLGGKIVGDELFTVGATDYSAQLTKIKAANPDGVMMVAVGEPQGTILKQARSLGLKGQFFGPLGTADSIRVGADSAEGFIDDVIALDPKSTDPQARLYQDSFTKKYNLDPDWTYGTPYEAVYVLRDLVGQVAKSGGDIRSGEALLKALETHPEFQNSLAGGTVHFTADHSTNRALAIRKVSGGKFEILKMVQPSKS